MARVYTKIGDIFSIQTDEKTKRYFQLIAYDLSQLNSDVFRVFKKPYPINQEPDLSEVVKDDVEFYVHCTASAGVKMGLWTKVGSSKDIGETGHILFRSPSFSSEMKAQKEWWVWQINGDSKFIGKLEKEYLNSFIGVIIPPIDLLEMIQNHGNLINYPSF